MNTPRGIRNNNPGNIRRGNEWQGQIPDAQRTDSAFCQFVTPEYGIRAMCIILRNYQQKHGLNTVSGIIRRWAPPGENDTQAYIDNVARATGVTPDQPVDTGDPYFMTKLLQAIIRHENGIQPYGADVFARALDLAEN